MKLNVLNEGWEGEGIEDPFPKGLTPEEQKLEGIHDFVMDNPELLDLLRKNMLSPEEMKQIEFEKAKRERRDKKAFETSMKAHVKTPITCEEVKAAIIHDLRNPLLTQEETDADYEENQEVWDHWVNCPSCQEFKENAEYEMGPNAHLPIDDDDDLYF